ncbi:hypothetical protein AB0D49_06895 [Streptomyces sp. NPDC048290]|uniref:hypothetical protein n=1 Tax=Streptomyces sp. NPDC048290 TaxID=3155811 RepID=UPI0034271C48
MSFFLRLADPWALVGLAMLIVLAAPVLLRQLLLFLGYQRALRGVLRSSDRVSLFTAFSAALGPHQGPDRGSGPPARRPARTRTPGARRPADP